jgi:acyl-CoA thioester hydrolase
VGLAEKAKLRPTRLYQKTLLAGWGDVDANAHMRNVSYLDKAVDLRLLFFAENGFPMEKFKALGIGPVVMKDVVEYFREIALLESFTGTLALAGLADDGSRFRLRNEFLRADGKLAARITSTGGWLDLSMRRLIAPAEELLAALRALSRTADFESLPSSLRP